ncbi:hypothetical protein M436DRAFT_81808 [Aureobasidium namibiae CBS 147.97]|uniref:Fork-head domain-containing protein n=1 Tax=Aureobasidium namibiae CBS 147.97 TaxID=1043004 RepID=A0A074WK12_9PEZI
MQPAPKRRKIESPVSAAVTRPSRVPSQGSEQQQSPRLRKYDQLIGMALHNAPEQCLRIDEVYEWIIENVPDHNLEDKSWRDGIWVALAENNDFIRRDGASEGLWTFREDASMRYRPQDQTTVPQSRAGASPQEVHDNNAHAKRGVNTFMSLTSAHDLVNNDFELPITPVGQTSRKLSVRARSQTSVLPSTIDDTIDVVDLTLDEDEQSPPVADPQDHQKPPAERTVTSLLDEMPDNISERNQRPSFAEFGEPTWIKQTITTPTQKSLTPFTDRILETASKQDLERVSGTEKWKAAKRHVNNLLGSPPRAIRPTDRAQTSIPRSPKNTSGLKSLSSQPPESVAVPSTESPYHGTIFTRSLLDVDDTAHKQEQQQVPDPTENIEQSDTVDHGSKQASPAPNDESTPMDLDRPEESLKLDSGKGFLPELTQISDDATLNQIEPVLGTQADKAFSQESQLDNSQPQERPSHEPLLQEHHKSIFEQLIAEEPISKEPIAEEPVVEEQLVTKTPWNAYVNSAAQTDLAAAPSLALGNITHVSLEPEAPVGIAPAVFRQHKDSATQTERAPEPQAAPHLLPQALPAAAQDETTGPSVPKTKSGPMTRAKYEKKALKLLKEYMYRPQEPQTDQGEAPAQEEADPFSFDREAKMAEIRARPTCKQIFGKVALSRVAGNDALTRLNKIVLGKDRLETVNLYKGYTEEEIAEEKRLNAQEGHYENLEELLNLPQRVVPLIHEQQLAFRDYAPAPNGSRRVPRAKHIFKLGPNARW